MGVKHRSLLVQGTTLALACALAPAARAETIASAVAPDQREHARELMRAGNARYRVGDVQAAHDLYEQAFAAAKSFDVACNLGRTEMELQRYRDAAEHLDYCVRFHILSSKPEAMLNEQEAREQLQAARARVGSIWLRVEPSGSEVWVDSRWVGRAPLAAPIFVDPGSHSLRVTSPQFAEQSTEFETQAGREQTLEISLQPGVASATSTRSLPLAPAADTGSRQKPKSRWGAMPWITGGLAAVGVGIGTGFLLAANSKNSEKQRILDGLPEARPCAENTPHVDECSRVRDLAGDARTAQAIGYTSLGIGVAAGVTTAVLLLQAKHGTEARATSMRKTAVLPTFSRDRILISVDTSF
ncbi:MAG: PEGA domain-containing protein [Myxococcota bacterium]